MTLGRGGDVGRGQRSEGKKQGRSKKSRAEQVKSERAVTAAGHSCILTWALLGRGRRWVQAEHVPLNSHALPRSS